VTEKYGYQENFPNDDEPLSVPEEVYKLIRDQDRDGELSYPIKDNEDLIKEHIHEESFQEEEDLYKVQYPDEQKETLIFMFMPKEDDVVLPCFPHACEFEEAISLNDEEFEDPNEVSLAFVLTHEDKEMFSHVDGLMK
jgi:hypothetical protein